jgi:DNA-binding MarR family transcriptional regulator
MSQPTRRPRNQTVSRISPARRRASPASVDYQALARFRYQLRLFLAFSETAARKAGLTPQQHQALLAIKGFSGPAPASVGDLARFLLIRHHTAVELVNRMVKLGMLSRLVDGDDGRRVLVQLTKKGEQKLQELSRIHIEELRSVSPALGKILRALRRQSAMTFLQTVITLCLVDLSMIFSENRDPLFPIML